MNGNDTVEIKVYFHPEQVKYLERIFPEAVFSPEVSEAQLRFYNGQRSIIQFVRNNQRSR